MLNSYKISQARLHAWKLLLLFNPCASGQDWQQSFAWTNKFLSYTGIEEASHIQSPVARLFVQSNVLLNGVNE